MAVTAAHTKNLTLPWPTPREHGVIAVMPVFLSTGCGICR